MSTSVTNIVSPFFLFWQGFSGFWAQGEAAFTAYFGLRPRCACRRRWFHDFVQLIVGKLEVITGVPLSMQYHPMISLVGRLYTLTALRTSGSGSSVAISSQRATAGCWSCPSFAIAVASSVHKSLSKGIPSGFS